MPKLLAFDFDGVVIDSIQALKDVYFHFLAQFGVKGSEIEFEQLNGPSIKEIVSILKDKYLLDESFEALLKNYNHLLKEAYIKTPLIEGALNTLKNLYRQGTDLALVTSSRRSEVEIILKKYNLEKIFKFIITGDEVKKSKPLPDIYLMVKDRFKQHEVWAIEDSNNGIRSAKEAGIKVIYFDQFNKGTDNVVDCRINNIKDIPMILQGIEDCYCTVEKETRISIEAKEDYSPKISKRQDYMVNKIWEAAPDSKDLHLDKILYYLSHTTSESGVTISAFWESYKYFYYRLHQPSLDFDFIPLAVSGVCVNKSGLLLSAKRKNVTEYESREELVPSGGISSSSREGGFVNFRKQLMEELFEETSIDPQRVLTFKEIGIVKDLSNNVIDVCCQINLADDGELDSDISREYSVLSWKKVSAMPKSKLVPTSQGILNLINNLENNND